jgi:NTP pyrophosphatase (non-canonical NTP hydrolase)
MRAEEIQMRVSQELQRAKTLHPVWPTDAFRAYNKIVEECGEIATALNDVDEKDAPADDVIKEVIHTAAMCQRFLENFQNYGLKLKEKR